MHVDQIGERSGHHRDGGGLSELERGLESLSVSNLDLRGDHRQLQEVREGLRSVHGVGGVV